MGIDELMTVNVCWSQFSWINKTIGDWWFKFVGHNLKIGVWRTDDLLELLEDDQKLVEKREWKGNELMTVSR